jgi:hypothetical protein
VIRAIPQIPLKPNAQPSISTEPRSSWAVLFVIIGNPMLHMGRVAVIFALLNSGRRLVSMNDLKHSRALAVPNHAAGYSGAICSRRDR